MDLSNLMARRHLAVDLGDGGEALKITYVRNRVSADLYRRIQEFSASEVGGDYLVSPLKHTVDVLLHLGLEWDLTDGGQPVPVTEERLMEYALVADAIYRAVNEDLTPKERKSDPSNSG